MPRIFELSAILSYNKGSINFPVFDLNYYYKNIVNWKISTGLIYNHKIILGL